MSSPSVRFEPRVQAVSSPGETSDMMNPARQWSERIMTTIATRGRSALGNPEWQSNVSQFLNVSELADLPVALALACTTCQWLWLGFALLLSNASSSITFAFAARTIQLVVWSSTESGGFVELLAAPPALERNAVLQVLEWILKWTGSFSAAFTDEQKAVMERQAWGAMSMALLVVAPCGNISTLLVMGVAVMLPVAGNVALASGCKKLMEGSAVAGKLHTS